MGAAGEGERPDAKQNAQLCPTLRQALRPSAKQAAGGAPRPRRKDAQATRQPVTRTHGRARPAAKPPRPPTRRRPAGAGVAPPPPHAQQRHDHARGRRNGGETGGDGAGRAALGRDCWPPPPLPSAQKKRHARTRKPRARPTWRPAHHGGRRIHPCADRRASGRARSGARPERRRADRPPLVGAWDGLTVFLCPLCRFFGAVVGCYVSFPRKTPRRAKKRKIGLAFVYVIVIYSGCGCMSPTERSV